MDDLELTVTGKGLWVGRQAGSVPAIVCRAELPFFNRNKRGQMDYRNKEGAPERTTRVLSVQVAGGGALAEGSQPLGTVRACRELVI